MARIDGSKSSNQARHPSHLVCRMICTFLNYIAFCYQSYRWLIDGSFQTEQATRINITEILNLTGHT